MVKNIFELILKSPKRTLSFISLITIKPIIINVLKNELQNILIKVKSNGFI